MRLINRGVVVIRARQPFVDWINQTTPDEPPVTLAEVNRECLAILTPDLDNEIKTHAYLKRLKPQLFEMELSGWNTEEQTWPEKRPPACLMPGSRLKSIYGFRYSGN
jgi:hypothetical protein